jgi:hypothetical protein
MKWNKTHEELTADGQALVIKYEGDFSTKFKTRDLHPSSK